MTYEHRDVYLYDLVTGAITGRIAGFLNHGVYDEATTGIIDRPAYADPPSPANWKVDLATLAVVANEVQPDYSPPPVEQKSYPNFGLVGTKLCLDLIRALHKQTKTIPPDLQARIEQFEQMYDEILGE